MIPHQTRLDGKPLERYNAVDPEHAVGQRYALIAVVQQRPKVDEVVHVLPLRQE